MVVLKGPCLASAAFSPCWATPLGSQCSAGPLVLVLWRLHFPLVPYTLCLVPLFFTQLWDLCWPEWLVVLFLSCPLLYSRGETCPKPKVLSLLSWLKCFFLSKRLLTTLSTSPLNKEPRHGGILYSTFQWTCSYSPQLQYSLFPAFL